MEVFAVFLAALAFILAVPVPRLLHRAPFRARSPWTAMVLWQAIALAGGLSIVGAPMVYGLAPFGSSLPDAIITVLRLLSAEDYLALQDLQVHPTHIFALCLGVMVATHLLLVLARTFARVLAARRRHRDLIELLSTSASADQKSDHDGDTGPATHIIEHAVPLAYCLPGRTQGQAVTVLSRGLLDQLTESELATVLAHEKTHLIQRHHLLIMAFEAWYRALPWLPTTRYGREAVREITEMLADDGALEEGHSREDLLRAIAATSSDSEILEPEQSFEQPTAQQGMITGERLKRLLIPPQPLGPAAQTAVVGAAVLLMAAPTTLLALN